MPGHDVVTRIRSYNAGREPERLALKYRAISARPFAFLRGTCHLYYEDLPREPLLEDAPQTWCCGDLHLENFGSYRGDNGLTYFDINDFDEAALAPCSWDLIRLASSVVVAEEALGVSEGEAIDLAATVVAAYAGALADGKPHWVERATAKGLVRHLLRRVKRRSRSDFLDTRTRRRGDHRGIRYDNDKALPIDSRERRHLQDFMAVLAARHTHPRGLKLLDAARRISGTGSLGVARYILLVRGRGSPNGNDLLDLKQARAPASAARLPSPQPSWDSEAERVVTVQRRLQAVHPANLMAITLDGVPFVLRALQPSEDRVRYDRARGKLKRLRHFMRTLGQISAWAHLRGSGRQGATDPQALIDFGRDPRWPRALLDVAVDYSRLVQQQWREFRAIYGEGAVED